MNQLSNFRKVQRTREDIHNITCQANFSLISLTSKIWLSIECVASKTVTHQKQLHSILIRLLRHVLLETSSYVYGVFGAQRSRDCTVTVLVSQIKIEVT